MNYCFFTGRLTKEPEISRTVNGKSYSRFTLAVDNPKDANGNKTAEFINFIAWNALAEMLPKYYTKGTKAAVVGKFHENKYTDNNGNAKSYIEFIVDRLELLSDGKPKQETAPTAPTAPQEPITSAETLGTTDDGSVLPFEI